MWPPAGNARTKTLLLLGVLGGLALILWLRYAPPTSPWSPRSILASILPQPKEIERIVPVAVPGPKEIRIIPKDRIIEYYNDLPTPQTVSDNAAVVTAVAEIPPSPEGGTALSVLKTDSDNVAVGHIEFQPKPIPFFKIKREMGIRGGYGTEGILGELYVKPLRVGPVELEGRVYGRSGNGESDFGAAVLLEWKF